MKRIVIPQAIIAAMTNAGREADIETLSAQELFNFYLQWHGVTLSGFADGLWEIAYRLRLGEQNIFAHRPAPSDTTATLFAPMRDRCAEVIVDAIIANGPQDIVAIIRECRNELPDYTPGFASQAVRDLMVTGELEFVEGKYDLTIDTNTKTAPEPN